MRTNLLFRFLILAFLLVSTINVFAWGMQGHRVVGEIASRHINAKAKKEIQNILGNESIAMASNWADFVKSDTNYKSYNIWHYVDLSAELDYETMVDSLKVDTLPNAHNKILWIIKQLKNKKLQQKEKQFYLRYLIHLIGDIHQPLHVSRKGDRGGNDIKVNWFSDPTNLHKIWDEELISYQQLSYTEYATNLNFITPQQKNLWQKDPLEKWLFESYSISEKIHGEVKSGEKLGFNYNFKMVETLNLQLLKGGIRLAGVLNEIFGS